jgi:hypothetical protein
LATEEDDMLEKKRREEKRIGREKRRERFWEFRDFTF